MNYFQSDFTFLASEREVRLEVIHYETSMYPDIEGKGAQATVDRQLPEDYDIHFGIMWKRCGTPTKDADSGTVHEFNLALDRREKSGRPVIMFYFSNEMLEFPSNTDAVEQLSKVIKFRERLSSIGLTVLYPNTVSFRERARIGLLRAVADILKNEPIAKKSISKNEKADTVLPKRILDLARKYETVREKMPPSGERTRAMGEIFSDMLAETPRAKRSLEGLKESDSPGQRLAAIAILQAFPDANHVEWLANRLNKEIEKPYIGYQAAVALMQATQSFPQSFMKELRKHVLRARQFAKDPNDSSRLHIIDYALKEIAFKEKQPV